MKLLGTGMLMPALPFPASSKRCTVNYSGEISLSIGTGWFDFAGSRLVGAKGRVGEVWKRTAAGTEAPALRWLQAGVWKQQQELLMAPSSLPEGAGAGIRYWL